MIFAEHIFFEGFFFEVFFFSIMVFSVCFSFSVCFLQYAFIVKPSQKGPKKFLAAPKIMSFSQMQDTIFGAARKNFHPSIL
jgi:hypothetical protein